MFCPQPSCFIQVRKHTLFNEQVAGVRLEICNKIVRNNETRKTGYDVAWHDAFEFKAMRRSTCLDPLHDDALPAPGRCRVALIPHTRLVTTLDQLRVGDQVNLEGDLIGKYVGKMLAPWRASVRSPEPGQDP